MLTDDQLNAIRARAQAATPGPWKHHRYLSGGWYVATPKHGCLLNIYCNQNGNACFIAHAREDVPALLAEVDRLRAEVDSANRREAHINQALNEGNGAYMP